MTGSKRSGALQSLSRDHHQTLVIAQRLRRAEDPAKAGRQFLEFWKQSGEVHFRVEEEILLPCWALLGTVDGEAAARLAREHLGIRRAAMALERRSPSLEQVHRLGEELEVHVRFEERELFRLLEADLDEDGLTQVEKAVSDAEEQLGASHNLGVVF
jgi:hemerythrin-like domain-containing protein